ncbi:MAG: penicillin acylase family protein [Alphaproteobacteria bacterium]
MRWLARVGFGLLGFLALVAVVVIAGVRSFYASLPSYDREVRTAALTASVTIMRDKYAIPHIIAESYNDAAFALGFAHAQDRLWQMEMARRFMSGRLSEILGEAGLRADVTMRALGFYRAAQASFSHLSPRSRAALQAYADGVNAYLSNHSGPWPIEFALAGITPEPWRPADSVAVLKGMSFNLSENASREIARVKLLKRIGRRGLEEFFSPYPGDSVSTLPDYLDSLFGTTQYGAAQPIPRTTASNSWAVNGAHSVTGKPLLANDPHLPLTIPSTWYLAHLVYPGNDLAGGTLPGIPTIIAGRNAHAAWGLTNTGPDTQDIYLERLNPENADEYRTPEGWAKFETRREVIRVRFGDAKRVIVRATRHGPVLPKDGIFSDIAPDGYVMALAWTALAADDTTIETSLAVHEAFSAAAFPLGAAPFISPMQNFLFADDSGHIGLMLPGLVPMRAPENDSLGLVPAKGWDARYDWTGWVPEMPLVMDPPSGRLVTANEKTVPRDYPYMLSLEWSDPFRHDRIEELLSATGKHSVAGFEAIQRDTIDAYARVLKPLLVSAGPFEGKAREAAALIEKWDGAANANRPEPLIYAAWARALNRRLYADELGDSFSSFWSYQPQFILQVLRNGDGAARWCDDRSTAAIEDCPSRIRLALDDALSELSESYGADMHRWRWGDAHRAVHAHRPLGAFPVIGKLFNREVEMNGGAFTIFRADYSFASQRPYAAIHGAGYRAIYDLAGPARSRYVISTGQSGNVFSPHYDDLMPLWKRGDYVSIPTSAAALEEATVHKMVIRPSP